jgi:hypothetical protein
VQNQTASQEAVFHKKALMKFDDLIIAEFEKLIPSKFTVSFTPPKIFICGGDSDVKNNPPLSLRHRLIDYFAKNDQPFSKSLVLAEDFKDYFKENAYSDLLEFETDIANIATLIIICLESPGALVELGLFCINPANLSRLLVVVPAEKIAEGDSFISLGPLQNISKRDKTSVVIYPWPKPTFEDYEHIDLIAKDIKTKLSKMHESESFNIKNSAHIALLMHDIIFLCAPIKQDEIELAITALELDIERKIITRLLYLLEKLEIISQVFYSNVTYYFVPDSGSRRIKFGTDKIGRVRDTPSLKMAFKQSFIKSDDEQSKKRRLALKQIQNTHGESL